MFIATYCCIKSKILKYFSSSFNDNQRDKHAFSDFNYIFTILVFTLNIFKFYWAEIILYIIILLCHEISIFHSNFYVDIKIFFSM